MMMGNTNDEVYRLLQASISREMNKAKKEELSDQKIQQMAKRIVELEGDLKKIRAIMTVSAGYLESPLQHIEDILRSGATLPYESLADYSKLARFMYAAHGRKHIAEVAEKLMREQSE